MNKKITKIQKDMEKFFKGIDLELVKTAIVLSYQIGQLEVYGKELKGGQDE